MQFFCEKKFIISCVLLNFIQNNTRTRTGDNDYFKSLHPSLNTAHAQLEKESKIFVFDTKKNKNVKLMDFHEHLMYVIGRQHYTFFRQYHSKQGDVSFCPLEAEKVGLERDDHIVIARRSCDLSDDVLNDLFDRIDDDDEWIKLFNFLNNKIDCDLGDDAFDSFNEIRPKLIDDDEKGSRVIDDEMKSVLFEVYCDEAFDGMSIVSRNLLSQRKLSGKVEHFSCPAIRHLFENHPEFAQNYNYEVHHIVFLDSNYYEIPLSWRNKLSFPPVLEKICMDIDFIEVYDQNDDILTVAEERMLPVWNDTSDYSMFVAKYQDNYRLLLVPKDKNVFSNLSDSLHCFFFKSGFGGFAEGVGLEQWSGRNETEKLRDARLRQQKIEDQQKLISNTD